MRNRKILTGLFLFLFALPVKASLVQDRSSIGNSLNNNVKKVTEDFRKVDPRIQSSKIKSESLKKQSYELLTNSEEESNPTVFIHGKVNMPNCDYDTQLLAWNGDTWVCQNPEIGQDCAPADDEYKYINAKGETVCSRIPPNGTVDGYWKFVDYGKTCLSSNTRKIIYSCNYKNKLNEEVEIDGHYCSNKKKPSIPSRPCFVEPTYTCSPYGADWTLGYNMCYKTERQCKYNTSHPKYMMSETKVGNSYYCTAYWGNDGSFSSSGAQSNCNTLKSGERIFYKNGEGSITSVCSDIEVKKNALPICPAGFFFDNASQACI